MILERIQDLVDAAARDRAQAWFDRFETAYVGEAQACKAARAQLETHLIEALEADARASAEQVETALARLGSPEEIAEEWSGEPAASPPEDAGKKVFRLAASLARGVCAVLGLVLLAAVFARLSDPAAVGVFELTDGTWLVGTVNDQAVSRDVLGVWTLPVALTLALALMIGASAGSGLWSAIPGWRKHKGSSPSS
ncbi:hypothetical protein [Oceanicaulis sp. MMSF_3324]|uniref:hypothetical protein n=1 Tax=Oceanicaulis sp. MMSF_3324 TaxID=3046702 RepID=UPI00273DDBA9|nr:hypothetical protein [Oceanicaulis sp. MMSF_3324]